MSWVSNDTAAEREAMRQQFLPFKLDAEEYGLVGSTESEQLHAPETAPIPS